MDDPPDPPAPEGSRYDAFISYSRVDRGVADALERALEAYRPPPGVGPDRRLRVFRDEGDLTGAEYGQAINEALRASDRLIVLCSPDARASRWVDDEIRRFLALRGPEHVVPVLVAGIPNNEGAPEDPRLAFPEALMEAMGMPLAPHFMGFSPGSDRVDRGRYQGAWFTLVATLLDVSREEVEERERVRRTRLLRRVAGGTAVLVAAMAALTIWALVSAAGQRRARWEAEAGLLEARAESAARGDLDALRSPAAALLVAREALVVGARAGRGRRFPGAESVIHRGLASSTGRGLAGWQEPVPRQTGPVPWIAADTSGRWLVTGDRLARWARVWDLEAAEPGTTGVLLNDTHAAAFVGGWLVGAGQGGALRAWPLAEWSRPTVLRTGDGTPTEAWFGSLEGTTDRVVAHTVTRSVVVEAAGAELHARDLPDLAYGTAGTAGGRWVARHGMDGLEVVDVEAPERVLRGEEARAALLASGVEAVELGRRFDGMATVVFPADADPGAAPGAVAPDGRTAVLLGGFDAPLTVRTPFGAWTLTGSAPPFRMAGGHVVAAHREGGVAAWSLDAGGGDPVHHWPDLPHGFDVSPDGRWLVGAAAAADFSDRIWPEPGSATGRLHRLDASLSRGPAIPFGTLRSGAQAFFTPDGRWMVHLGIRDHTLIDLAAMEGGSGYDAPVGATTWVPGSDVLYTTHGDGTVRRWEPRAGGVSRSSVVVAHGPELASLEVSSDERWLVGEPGAGGLGLWRRTGEAFEPVPDFEIGVEEYGALDWGRDDVHRGLWDEFGYYAGDGGYPLAGGGRPGRALPVRFDTEARVLQAALAGGGVLRWSLDDPGAPPARDDSGSGSTGTARGAGRTLPADPMDAGPASDAAGPGDPDRVASVQAVDPTGRWMALDCGRDAELGRPPAFGPNGRWLATWRGVWDLEAAPPTARGSRSGQADADPDASESRGCSIRSLLRPSEPDRRLRLDEAVRWPDLGGGMAVAGRAFSPDGRWLVARYSYGGNGVCGYGTEFHILDLAAPDPSSSITPLWPGDGGLNCPEVRFDRSSRWLITGRFLWDLTSERRATRPVELPGELLDLHPDGSLAAVVVGADAQALVRFVALEPEALVDEVCVRVGRNLSFEEWRAAFPGEPYRALCPDYPVPPPP